MAEVIQFPRNTAREIETLIDLRPEMTGEEILRRHRRLATLRAEAHAASDAGRGPFSEVERLTNYLDGFHRLAARSGVSEADIGDFNAKRDDWRAWKAYRDSLPANRRF